MLGLFGVLSQVYSPRWVVEGAWGCCDKHALCSAQLQVGWWQSGPAAASLEHPLQLPLPCSLPAWPPPAEKQESTAPSNPPRKELKCWAENVSVCVIPPQPPTAKPQRESLASPYKGIFFSEESGRELSSACARSPCVHSAAPHALGLCRSRCRLCPVSACAEEELTSRQLVCAALSRKAHWQREPVRTRFTSADFSKLGRWLPLLITVGI